MKTTTRANFYLSSDYQPPRIARVVEHRGGPPGRETSIVATFHPDEKRWIEARVPTSRATGPAVPTDHPDYAAASSGAELGGDRSVDVHNQLGYSDAATRRGLDTDY